MRVKLSDLTKYSKGVQINGDDLIDNGKYIYLNGGINPSGRWNEANVSGNTITISEGGNSSGYVNYLTEPFWCGAHCYYLYDGPKNTRYLYYALKSQQERLFHIRSGACMPNIKKADLGKFEFEFNLDENKQEEVVSALSMVESIIDERKSELVLLDNIIKARFVEMFDTCSSEILIGDVISISRGASPRPIQAFITNDKNGVNWIKIGDVPENSLYITNTAEKITKEGAKKSREVHKGDFILSNSMSFGRPFILRIDGCVHDGWLILSDFRDTFNELYLYYALRSEHVQYQFGGKVNGATVKNLNSDLVKATSIKIPKMKFQEQFANFVKQVDKSKFVKINLVIYQNTI